MPEHTLEHNPIRHVERIVQKDARGREVGEAMVYVVSDPFPFCYVKDVDVLKDERGNGFGSALIEQVNAYIRSQKMLGVLINGASTHIEAYDIQTRKKLHIKNGFYARHAWVQSEIKGMMFFNNIDNKTEEDIARAYSKALRHVGI